MRKLLVILMIGTAALFTPTGCVKSDIGGSTSPLGAALADIPDLTNFLVQASTSFVANLPAIVHIFSTSLGNGTFTVNYNITGNNTASGKATLTMYGGQGTFSTSVLTSAGPSTITVTSITSTAGKGASASVSANNTSSMFDSSGYMGANYYTMLANKDSTATQFSTYQVTPQLAGTLLTISGVMWLPNLTTVSITDYHYTGATGIFALTGGPGAGGYTLSVSPGGIADISSYGSCTILTTSPLLTGTFYFKNPDSSSVAGSFSCPAP